MKPEEDFSLKIAMPTTALGQAVLWGCAPLLTLIGAFGIIAIMLTAAVIAAAAFPFVLVWKLITFPIDAVERWQRGY